MAPASTMKIFPLLCASLTLALYLLGYNAISSSRAVPTTSVAPSSMHAEPYRAEAREGAPRGGGGGGLAATAALAAPLPRLPRPEAAHAVAPAAMPAAAPTGTAAAVLDGTIEAALKLAVPAGRPPFVLATFGNLGVKEHLLNFVSHCRRAGIPHVVGAVDLGAYDLLRAQGTPVYKTPLALEDYQLDGSNSHASGSWKKFAGMRTGEVRRIVHAGYSVMHTDCDVIWMRDPSPYLMCAGGGAGAAEWANGTKYPCAPMRAADVAVSSDNMSPDKDAAGHAAYSAGGTFNTGLLFIRATAAGKRFVSEWHRLVTAPPRGSRFAALTSDQQVFNHMMRRPNEWPGISAPHGSHTMLGWDKSLTLGALPLPLFINGHGYFVQSAHTRLQVRPLAVHATYSLDNHDGLAKTQRFREAGLWDVDAPAYFAGQYLVLNNSVPPPLQAAIDKYVAKGTSSNNIDTHGRALAGYVAELRDALALARALGRTLVLPRWTCYCDRLWSGSDDIFHFGCMYPGAQEGKFLPFVCPMDHVLSPNAWKRTEYRDAAFLSSPQLPAAVKDSIVELELLPREKAVAFALDQPIGAKRAALPLGTTDAEARRLLAPHAAAAVLRLPHARGLLCGLELLDAAVFNAMSRELLAVPAWCAKCFQPCASELLQWLTPTEISTGGGGNFFCLHVPRPPAFKHGQCVLNVPTA